MTDETLTIRRVQNGFLIVQSDNCGPLSKELMHVATMARDVGQIAQLWAVKEVVIGAIPKPGEAGYEPMASDSWNAEREERIWQRIKAYLDETRPLDLKHPAKPASEFAPMPPTEHELDPTTIEDIRPTVFPDKCEPPVCAVPVEEAKATTDDPVDDWEARQPKPPLNPQKRLKTPSGIGRPIGDEKGDW